MMQQRLMIVIATLAGPFGPRVRDTLSISNVP